MYRSRVYVYIHVYSLSLCIYIICHGQKKVFTLRRSRVCVRVCHMTWFTICTFVVSATTTKFYNIALSIYIIMNSMYNLICRHVIKSKRNVKRGILLSPYSTCTEINKPIFWLYFLHVIRIWHTVSQNVNICTCGLFVTTTRSLRFFLSFICSFILSRILLCVCWLPIHSLVHPSPCLFYHSPFFRHSLQFILSATSMYFRVQTAISFIND